MSPPPTPDPGVSVELYVRSLAPRAGGGRLERTVRRLAELDDRDDLAEYQVYVTGKTVPPSPAAAVTEFGVFLHNRVAVFQEWADRTGRSLDCCFERRSVESRFTGERHDAIAVPELLLAEYEDGDLRFVAPCRDGETQVTVADRLTALEADVPTREADRLERARADPSAEFSTVGR